MRAKWNAEEEEAKREMTISVHCLWKNMLFKNRTRVIQELKKKKKNQNILDSFFTRRIDDLAGTEDQKEKKVGKMNSLRPITTFTCLTNLAH